MESKKHIKKTLLALVMAVALVGAGYGMSSAVKTADHPAPSITKTSDIPMVPANFSDLAEKVRQGVVNIQVVKTVEAKVLRGGNAVECKVKIAEMEQKEEVTNVSSSTHKPLGMTVQNITPEIAKGLGLKSETGILVANVVPGSPAAKADIRSGDVIQEVNRKPVKNVDDFKQKIEKAKGQETILLLIQRGKTSLFAALTPAKG